MSLTKLPSNQVTFKHGGTGSEIRTLKDKLKERVSVLDFGAVGDGVTDDLAAFNAALAAVAASGKALYIPGVKYWYRLSNTFTIGYPNISIYGDGVSSLLLIDNVAGADCVKLTDAKTSLQGIGITGVNGCGSGLVLHYPTAPYATCHRISDVWVGWVDEVGVKVVSGQDNTFTNVSVDQNIGYRPASSADVLAKTTHALSNGTTSGFQVLSGDTNSQTFIGCKANAAASTGFNVTFGDTTTDQPSSCNWFGGVIQGSAAGKEVYLSCIHSIISGCHIEDNTGLAVYGVEFRYCSNTVIENCILLSDVYMVGCTYSGLRNVVGQGLSIGSPRGTGGSPIADSTNCFWHYGTSGNVSTGPTAGAILDNTAGGFDIRHVTDNARQVIWRSDILSDRDNTVYLKTNMEDWWTYAGDTNPCGFFGARATKSTGIFRTGTSSAKIIPASEYELVACYVNLAPINQFKNKYVTITAWVWNQSTSGSAAIVASIDGGIVTVPSAQLQIWEKITATMYVPSTATTAKVVFTGLAGDDIYLDAVEIAVENYTPVQSLTLDGTATPVIGYGSHTVPTLITSGTPTITYFYGATVGKPFTVIFKTATVIQDNASMYLKGTTNFTGASNDVMTLVLGSDSVIHEVSRSIRI